MTDATRYQTDSATIDWLGMKQEINAKLDALMICWQASEREAPPEVHAAMVRDLYAPMVKLLAEFCGCIQTHLDETDVRVN